MPVTTEQLNELAQKIRELREKENEAAQVKKAITQELEIAEGTMLQLLEESSLTSYQSPFGRIGISYRTSVRVPRTVEDRTAFYSFLKERGKFDLLITVNSQTLNAFYKEELNLAKEQGLDDFNIPGLNEVTITPILSFTKGNL